MADLWSPQVALPDKVEQLLQKICREQNQGPPNANVRQKLASLGEEAALDILRVISASVIRKSLGGFIVHMIDKASSQRLAPVSPLRTASSPSPPTFSPPQGGRLVMDSQTPQSGYYTNLITEDDLEFECTNEISEQQQASPEVEVEPTIKKSCRGSNFTIIDDNWLVEAWLYVSMDAVQGNQQKHKIYWKRICDYFNEHKTHGANRNQTSLMNRWSTIQLAVNKFCGFLAQIEKRSQSGLTEQDKIGQARLMYLDIQKSPFHFEHAWLILRFHPKWAAHMDNVKLKKKEVVINLGDEEASPKGFEVERPIGRKAEKEKRKSKEKSNPSVIAILSDMNEDKKKKIKLLEEAREQDKAMFILKQEEVRLKEDELRLREKTFRFEKEREIKEFMLMDASHLDEDGQEYVRRRKKAILEGQIHNP